jgi:hypothetical protein
MIVWPVYVYLAIKLFGLGASIAKHGEYIKINFWSILLSTAFIWFLLYKDGFFDVLIK